MIRLPKVFHALAALLALVVATSAPLVTCVHDGIATVHADDDEHEHEGDAEHGSAGADHAVAQTLHVEQTWQVAKLVATPVAIVPAPAPSTGRSPESRPVKPPAWANSYFASSHRTIVILA